MYYGQYAKYLEMGRVEALRSLGFSYKSMEDSGVMMPVLDLNIKYIKPLYYDDKITLITRVIDEPVSRIYFEYELHNPLGKLSTKAQTTLVFVDVKSGKPCSIPDYFKLTFTKYFNS
jgi:acyl-CoA thioester hydrolase